jgi:hypothetical protein
LAAASVVALGLVVSAPAFGAAPPAPSFVATSPVLSFASDGVASTTVEVLNPGAATSVHFEMIVAPRCQAVASERVSKLVGTGVTTVAVSFKESFDTSFTGATLVMAPASTPLYTSRGCAKAKLSSSAPATLPGASATSTTITTATSTTATTTATAIPTTPATPGAAAGAAPAVILLSLHRDTTAGEELWWPLVAGFAFALLAVLVTVITIIVAARRSQAPSAQSPVELWTAPRWRDAIKASSSWNYKDSIATNVTAVGAVLAAVLSAAGSSAQVFPDVTMSRFSLVNVLYGAITVVAPLWLGFWSSIDTVKADPAAPATTQGAAAAKASAAATKPAIAVPYWVLLVAIAITLTATGGALATLWVLATLAATTSTVVVFVHVLVVVAGLVVIGYVAQGTLSLVSTREAAGGPHTKHNVFEATSFAA